MGVTGSHAGDAVFIVADGYRMTDDFVARQVNRDLGRVQLCLAHIYRYRRYLAVAGKQLQVPHAGGGGNGHLGFGHHAVIVQVLAHAANGVAGHTALAAVHIENAHSGVGNHTLFNQYNTVSADTLVPVGEFNGQTLRTGDDAALVVEENVVVAAALHFGEFQQALFAAHVVNVHQLGVHLIVARGDNICQGIGGVQAGQGGNAQLIGPVVQLNIVCNGLLIAFAGVDNVVQFAALYQVHNGVVLAQLVDHMYLNTQRANSRCRLRRCP